MAYHQRLAKLGDTKAIALLYQKFIQERVEADSSMKLKSEYDWEHYIEYQLKQRNHYCFLLESPEEKGIVGFLLAYAYDETPPPPLPDNFPLLQNPFQPRRIGSVIGLYIEPNHRKLETINLLVQKAIAKAQELKLTDIELLINIEQKVIQNILARNGFKATAIQYSRHFTVTDTDLPSLHDSYSHLESGQIEKPLPTKIPLRDLKTQEIVKNKQGETVFLEPIKDEKGNYLRNYQGNAIYPVPVRNPDTNNWAFDQKGKLVVCPLLRDEKGNLVENQGIPQFRPPLYQMKNRKLSLKRDSQGNYLFAEAKRDEQGQIIRTSEGKAVFETLTSYSRRHIV